MSKLTDKQRAELLNTLEARFEKNMTRHPGLDWGRVQARLDAKPDTLRSLHDMEQTGGEPDVVEVGGRKGEVTFIDCAAQSPKGRRSCCYDGDARRTRKEHPPKSSALELAADMGIELLTEEQYRALQQLGEFDTTTSSWLQTPAPIRKLGGAIYGDRRYDRVFVSHNGAESYYAARAFRGILRT